MSRPDPKTARYYADEALKQLLLKALAGDEKAYTAFLDNVARILRTFLRRSMPPEKVEDLVQEVLITVHKKRDLYRASMPVIPWLRAIAKHRLIDTVRAEARRPELVELNEQLEKNFVADQVESAIDMEQLLSCLDERQRQILQLAKVEGASHAEIAAKMGLSIAAVKVSVHRSLNFLRKTHDEKK